MAKNWREVLRNADQAAEKLYLSLILPLITKYGIEITTSPRVLQENLFSVIANANKIEMAADNELLYLFHLPHDLIPETWDQLTEMMEASMNRETSGIYIDKPPIGSTPEIAQAWVGLTVPFSPNLLFPLAFITPELAASGVKSSNGKCYILPSAETIRWFEGKHFEGAQAYKKLRPHWDRDGESLIFDGDSSIMVVI